MLTDKQILGPGVTDITFLLDIFPVDGREPVLSPEITKILSYGYLKSLHLVRMPRCLVFSGLNIPELKPEYSQAGNLIIVDNEECNLDKSHYYYAPSESWRPKAPMIEWAKDLFDDADSADVLWSKVLSVASASLMSRHANSPCLLVTNDMTLLSRQVALQKMFTSDPLRIVTESEALRILDLHQKQLRCYSLRPCCTADRHSWYWAAVQSDLPNVSERSLVVRAMHIRYAIDALGSAYYGNDSSAATEESAYHFDYVLLLLTASLDAAALQVATHYGLEHNSASMRPPESGKTTGKHAEFYKKIKKANSAIAELWTRSATFLQILYDLRDATAHLEILDQFASNHIPKYSGQSLISVNLSNWEPGHAETVEEMFRSTERQPTPFEPCSSLGVLPIGLLQKALNFSFLLEPYHFSVEAWVRVRCLLNESAKLTGSPVQLQETADDPHNWLQGWTRTFKDQALNGLRTDAPDS